MASTASQMKLPDISTQSIYAGKYKDWTPELRAVSNFDIQLYDMFEFYRKTQYH